MRRHIHLSLILVAGCDADPELRPRGEPMAAIRGSITSTNAAPAADIGVLWFGDGAGQCRGPQRSCGAGGGGSADAQSCVDACGPAPALCDAASQAAYGECLEACGWEHVSLIQWNLCVDGAVGERVAVDGGPADFTLELFEPPPAEALLADQDGLRVAYGWIIAAEPDAGAIHLTSRRDPPSAIIGGADRHVLIFAADPLPAGSAWAQLFGGPLEPGYHLLEVHHQPCDEPVDPLTGEACLIGPSRYSPSRDDLATEVSVAIAPFAAIRWPST
ncbi:MAG: hypothetical protein R3A79_03300 [Nannocystaceae bacterium]